MPRTKTRQVRTQIFSSALFATMERNAINQVQLSAATGIAVSRINNYLHGKYRTIRPDHLERMVKAVSGSAGERSELIRSYLLDLLPEALHGDIQFNAPTDKARPARAPRSEKGLLPSTTSAALAAMQAMSLRSAKARARVEYFAQILAETSPN